MSTDHGQVIDGETVRFERVFPGSAERLWAYLTEPEKRRLWFADGPMELRAGGAVTLFLLHARGDDGARSRAAGKV